MEQNVSLKFIENYDRNQCKKEEKNAEKHFF